MIRPDRPKWVDPTFSSERIRGMPMAKKQHLSAVRWGRWLKEWQASRQDEDELHATTEAALAGSDCIAIMGEAYDLALYFAVRGAIKVWANDQQGWDDLRAFFTLQSASMAFHICCLDEATASRGGKFVEGKMGISQLSWPLLNEIALLLSTAEVFGRTEFANWLGERLKESALKNDLLVRYPWSKTPYEYELVKMFALGKCNSPEEVGQAFGVGGVYQSLVDAWRSDEQFAQALVAACDFHLENCRTDDDVLTTLPYPFFPAEILAFVRYREHCGMTTLLPSHPLLETPFARVPDTFEGFDESHIARRVVERCARDYPIVAAIL